MISLIGFCILTLMLSYKFKEQIVMIMPVSIAILTGMLFLLAMIRHLALIDYCFGFFLIVILIILIWKRNMIVWERIKNCLTDVSAVAFYAAICIVILFGKDRMVWHWDELGCWGLEVKTLFFADGFSMPGMHTSINYSHYMPGQMLLGWWFCHLLPQKFHEGLIYIGYYMFFIAILAPVFGCGKSKNRILAVAKGILITILLLILPSVVSMFEYTMLSVEFSQSALVGIMVFELYNRLTTNSILRFLRWISCSFLLIMLKDSSIMFLAVIYIWALVLWLNSKHMFGWGVGNLAIGGGISAVVVFIWKIYVQINRRGAAYPRAESLVDKLLQYIANPSGADEQTLGYIKAFREAILQYPLHIDYTRGLNLTVAGGICLFAVVIYFFYYYGVYKWRGRELVITEVFCILSIVLYLLVILLIHMFYFNEIQYLEAKNAMHSISRYTEPLILGYLLFLVLTCFLNMNWKAWIAVACMIILFAEPIVVGKHLINGKNAKEQIVLERDTLVSKHKHFVEVIDDKIGVTGQSRILYVHRSEDLNNFNPRLFQFLLAPKAIYILEYDQYDPHNFLMELFSECKENKIDYIFLEGVESSYIGNTGIMNDYLYSTFEMESLLERGGR